MAKTLYMPNGNVECLFYEEEDFIKLVNQYMGEESAEIVKSMAKENAYQQFKASSDMGAYEAELESHNVVFNDLLDQMEFMRKELKRARLNRQNIYNVICECEEIINEQI